MCLMLVRAESCTSRRGDGAGLSVAALLFLVQLFVSEHPQGAMRY